MFTPDHPVLVQADGSILLDAHHARADEAREALAPYAEIVSSPVGLSLCHTGKVGTRRAGARRRASAGVPS